jgi:uncharacterized membrane protein YkvA (DUF1232 family)
MGAIMKISFDLSDKDLRYFREVLQKVRKGQSAQNENVILREAEALLAEVKRTDAPEFVQNRIAQLSKLTAMVEDKDWRLEGEDRKRVLNALAYFADPDDLIPDRVPGIGYLDDAIMVELVVQDLKHEIEAFDAFVAYREERRKAKLDSTDGLAKRRDSLQSRMRRRRRGDRTRHTQKRGRSPIALW